MDRFMNSRWAENGLPVVVLGFEVANFLNLKATYQYFGDLIAAILLAGCYSAILIAIAILIAKNLHWAVRALLMAAGLALYCAQAKANIMEASLHALSKFPAEPLAGLWGGSPQGWITSNSLIFGGVINFAGAAVWLALALLARQREKEQEAGLDQFRAVVDGLRR